MVDFLKQYCQSLGFYFVYKFQSTRLFRVMDGDDCENVGRNQEDFSKEIDINSETDDFDVDYWQNLAEEREALLLNSIKLNDSLKTEITKLKECHENLLKQNKELEDYCKLLKKDNEHLQKSLEGVNAKQIRQINGIPKTSEEHACISRRLFNALFAIIYLPFEILFSFNHIY